MKKWILALALILNSGMVMGGSLTITAPATNVPGGSTGQWQYNNAGVFTGVTPFTFVSSSTLTSTNTICLASAPAAGLPLLLPHSTGNTGQILQITKVNLSTYPVTIMANGADLIAGTTGLLTLNAAGQTDEIIADGAGNWWPHGQGIQATPPRLMESIYQQTGTFTENSSSGIVICPLYVTVPVTVQGFTYVTLAQGGASTIAFGIMDNNGNVVASTGPVLTGAVGARTVLLNNFNVNIPPGAYYLATQLNTTNAQIEGSGSTGNSPTGCSFYAENAMGIVGITLGTTSPSVAPAVSVLVSGGRTTLQ